MEHNLVFRFSYTLNEEYVCRTWSIVGEDAGCFLAFPIHQAAMIWSLAEGIGELNWIVSKNELFWFSEKYYFYLHDADYETEAEEIKAASQGHTGHTASMEWCWHLNTSSLAFLHSMACPFFETRSKGLLQQIGFLREHCEFMLLIPQSLNIFAFVAAAAKSLQSCPTVRDLVDSSPPGSSVHRILLARILEWVAMYFSFWWNAL